MSEAASPTREPGEFDAALSDEILRRAQAIQAERRETMTLADLKAAAVEMGVDVERVEEAAAELVAEDAEGSRAGHVLFALFLLVCALPGVWLAGQAWSWVPVWITRSVGLLWAGAVVLVVVDGFLAHRFRRALRRAP